MVANSTGVIAGAIIIKEFVMALDTDRSKMDEEDFHKRVKEATGSTKRPSAATLPNDYSGMKSAGREETDYSSESPASSKQKKTKTQYTNVTIDRKSFPGLAAKEIGESCLVICEIRKISESMPDFYDTDKDEKITIEILKIAEQKVKVKK